MIRDRIYDRSTRWEENRTESGTLAQHSRRDILIYGFTRYMGTGGHRIEYFENDKCEYDTR